MLKQQYHQNTLSNFWRSLEMPLINCEINLILICSTECVISGATGATKFRITLYSNSNFINSR